MHRFTILLILFILTDLMPQESPAAEKNVVSLRAGFITTSRLYLNPYASEEEIRNRSFDIDNIAYPSLEFRYPISGSLYLAATLEYISASAYGRNITVITDEGTSTIEIRDGYTVFITEGTLYYRLPFSTGNFRFYMAGGGGLYLASGIREIGDITLNGGAPDAGAGVHVLVGMEYTLTDYAELGFQMKFRNPDLITEGEYSSVTGNYKGRRITLAKKDYKSRISIDGTVFMLGVNIRF